MPVYTYTTLDDPLQIGFTTGAEGINDAGQIVGFYSNASGRHGFLYSGGTYTAIDDPSANTNTFANGINAAGQIVGGYDVGTVAHGFLLSGGTYKTLDYPGMGVTGTVANGINASGQVVGTYLDSTGSGEHGFLYNGTLFANLNDPSGTFGTTAPASTRPAKSSAIITQLIRSRMVTSSTRATAFSPRSSTRLHLALFHQALMISARSSETTRMLTAWSTVFFITAGPTRLSMSRTVQRQRLPALTTRAR